LKNKVYISLGSNLGDSVQVLQDAYAVIEERVGEIQFKSSFYRTEPWGFEAENDFINAVIQLNTTLSPKNLLQNLLDIENEFGRERNSSSGYQSRILDLDILTYNQLVLDEIGLIIPHPEMHKRAFVLVPLREIDDSWKHPLLNESVNVLLERIEDVAKVEKLAI
jgi:2-amino-4-hydroxy-6-hydroxymethyldihydropteridine diphosphokinase